MKLYKILYSILPVLALLPLAGMTSCDYIHDDLDPCKHYLRFSYVHNMKFADAFVHEMENQQADKTARLYIFDKEGKYLQTEVYSGDPLLKNRHELDLLPGTYRLLAWAGLNDTDYEWDEPATGSSIEDFKMKLKAGGQRAVERELLGLFQGEMTLELPADAESEHVMPLVKNTNKIRFVFIDPNSGTELSAGSFAVSATTHNSDLSHDNQPLSDEAVTFLPYYKGIGDVKGGAHEGAGPLQAVCMELNTLRLIDQADGRLSIRYTEEEVPFLNVDLTDFLCLTQMESHQLGRQEYLDRQDEYTVLVYVDIMGGKAHCLEVIVNDWTVRLDDLTLGKEN